MLRKIKVADGLFAALVYGLAWLTRLAGSGRWWRGAVLRAVDGRKGRRWGSAWTG